MLRKTVLPSTVVLMLLVPVISLSQVTLQPFLSGLSSPILLTNAHDGSNRLFIVQQGGKIMVLQPGSSTPTLFLDITANVVSGGEQGLLGLTFHRQYTTNRKFYVCYTRAGDGAEIVSEFLVSTTNPNVADPASERVLLVVPDPFPNHNGGMVEFGPDGYLYISFGDGGSANDPGNRAQDINQLLGKILRIDINTPVGTPYLSPSTNPFFGTTPGRDEIYAYGFRNTWRFSFDRATGQLWAGDVGQDQREEVDIVTLGGNYGWRTYEGTLCTGLNPTQCTGVGFVGPILEYGHTGGRCSITGGYVYRGPSGALPAGNYVYGDYCTGEIFLWNGTSAQMVMDTALNISSFGEDESGEVYVVGLGGTISKFINPNPCPLPAPAGLAPSGIVANSRPTLSWNAVPGAADYLLYLIPTADAILGNPAPSPITVATNSYTPPSALTQLDYAWTVAARSPSCGTSAFAPAKLFTIGGSCPLSPPSAMTPTGTAPPLPTFTWSSVANASLYVLYVVNASNSSIVLQKLVASPSYTATTALPSGNYAWVAFAYNSSCNASATSNVRTFVVP